MVWIHGGGFVVGDGGIDLYGPQYLMQEKDNPVVLVTINYRFQLVLQENFITKTLSSDETDNFSPSIKILARVRKLLYSVN